MNGGDQERRRGAETDKSKIESDKRQRNESFPPATSDATDQTSQLDGKSLSKLTYALMDRTKEDERSPSVCQLILISKRENERERKVFSGLSSPQNDGHQCSDNHPIDDKSMFKRAHALIDSTAASRRRVSMSSASLGVLAEPDFAFVDIADEIETGRPSLHANAAGVSEYFNSQKGAIDGAVRPIDDKSMYSRSYELIDQTARSNASLLTHSALSKRSIAEPSKSGEDGPSLAPSKEAYRVHRDAYSADVSRFEAVSLTPGVQYVPARAPGSATPLFLGMLRRETARRVQEGREAPHQHSVALPSPIEPLPDQGRQSSDSFIEDSEGQEHLSTAVEEIRKTPQRRWCVIGIVTTAFLLAASAAGLGIIFAVTRKGTSVAVGTRFNPYTLDCTALASQQQPHVVSQCYCNGRISTLSKETVASYIALADTFILKVYPDFQQSLDSCNAQNQALLWLASADGGTNADTMLQRFLLAMFFILWKGLQWTSYDGWLSSTNECLWIGVSCNEQGKVNGIDLHNHNLTGSLVSDLTLLSDLTSLTLDQNNIHGSLPSELGSLSLLQTLSVEFNQLTGSLPRELAALLQLQTLKLGNNMLNGTIPTWIGQLQILSTLSLSHNNTLSGESTAYSAEKVLLINNNESTIPTEVGLLTKLQSLELASTGINGTLPVELFRLGSTLQVLDVSSNFLTGSIPSLVGMLSALEQVSLNGNTFTGSIPSEFGNCRSITSLYLNNNKLTGTVPSSLGYLSSLQYLYLQNNPLVGSIPGSICSTRPYACRPVTVQCDCCMC